MWFQLALFFRTNAVRCTELDTTAQLLNPPVQIHHWPMFKEVRMVEFTVQILRAFAHNHRASLAYWKDLSEIGEDAQEKSKAKGFLKIWNKDRLHLLFVLLDTAEIFTRLQLKFQATSYKFLSIKKLRLLN